MLQDEAQSKLHKWEAVPWWHEVKLLMLGTSSAAGLTKPSWFQASLYWQPSAGLPSFCCNLSDILWTVEVSNRCSHDAVGMRALGRRGAWAGSGRSICGSANEVRASEQGIKSEPIKMLHLESWMFWNTLQNYCQPTSKAHAMLLQDLSAFRHHTDNQELSKGVAQVESLPADM